MNHEVERYEGELRELRAEVARLRSVVEEVHSWAVFAAFGSPLDMAQNFPRIVEITAPTDRNSAAYL